MRISLLCVGKLKERFYRDAADEYLKRLKRYGPVEECEVPDLPEPKSPSEAADRKVIEAEGERLLRMIRPGDHVIALCVDGERPDSVTLAQWIMQLEGRGMGRVAFVIGGSLGLPQSVLSRADCKLSLSTMTFPHALARVVLLEQLYRARKIQAGERYHK